MRTRLRMRELSRLTGVPPATIHFYRSQGLLPAPERTGRTMAYYDDRFVRRIRWIREVQERCRLSVRAMREILDRYGDELSVEEIQAAIALGELESLGGAAGEQRQPLAEVCRQREISEHEVAALVEVGLIQGPDAHGTLAASDVRMLELVGRLATVFEPALGFNVGFLRAYSALLGRLVRAEVREALTRTAGKLSAEELQSMIHRGLPLLNAIMSELHTQMVQRELSSLARAAKATDPAAGREPAEHGINAIPSSREGGRR